MGGKGGGGGNYYAQPEDTSGYGTPEEAKLTLAREAPLDLSQYQQSINVRKAAGEATAPDTPATPDPGGGGTDTGTEIADAILKPPEYWSKQALKPSALNKSRVVTTQT
jgi:hypothetical protein